MKKIDNFDFSRKKVIIRVDFNVPLCNERRVTDDTRILASLPTIKKVTEKGSAILMSHLGRPRGKDKSLSLKHIVNKLAELTGKEIKFVDDCIGDKVKLAVSDLKIGEILLLENLRFYSEEKKGDKNFARQLAELADVYVNDAFGTVHRAHASTTTIAKFFPKNKMFGYLIENELASLEKVFKDTMRPFTAILGGAKVSTKIPVIERLMEKVDNLIIGGGMTYTFIKANGGNVGLSLVEDDLLCMAKKLLEKAKSNNVNLYLPIDSINADKFSQNSNIETSPVDKIKDNMMGLDIGTKTIKKFTNVIRKSRTILWNGPVGVFEIEKFAEGTKRIADALVKATESGAYTLVGGGDTVAAVKKYKISDKVSYVSTGGGALLEFIEGKELAGIKAMERR